MSTCSAGRSIACVTCVTHVTQSMSTALLTWHCMCYMCYTRNTKPGQPAVLTWHCMCYMCYTRNTKACPPAVLAVASSTFINVIPTTVIATTIATPAITNVTACPSQHVFISVNPTTVIATTPTIIILCKAPHCFQ